MNSKQVNFYLLPDDLASIEEFFREKDIITIKTGLETPVPTACDVLSAYNEKIFQVHLTHKNWVNKTYFNFFEKKAIYYLDVLRSYALEFSIGGFYPYSDKELHRARLYFVVRYYDNQETLVSKSNEFVAWADSVIKDFKKHFLKRVSHSSDYFTEKCLKWIENTGAELNQGRNVLVLK
jgi:hypothetical protein